MEHSIIFHGSENSLDTDAYVLVDSPMSFKDAKLLCDSFKNINANLLHIEDGVVAWCYKGTVDECNNSILATYTLHEQEYPCPVTRKLERSYALKMMRTVRGLLSYFSRTEHREIVKKALRSSKMDEKIAVLRKIDIQSVKEFEKNSLIEVYKFLAFQLGQTYALLKDDKELFTKNEVSDYYPSLKVYLDRQDADSSDLAAMWDEFVEFIRFSYKNVEKQELICTRFHGRKEVADCKAEIVLPPVVVFDLDGTLMDEVHRSHLREAKLHEEYFMACDLDTPIPHIVKLTHEYHEKGYEVWLMSGRSEICEEKTIASMREHNVYFDKMKLRAKDNFTPDFVLKPAWISKYIGLERVDYVYDDTDAVIAGFRKKGLNVIDVKLLKPE